MDTSQDAIPPHSSIQNTARQDPTLATQPHAPDTLYGNIDDEDITEEMFSQEDEFEQRHLPEPPNHLVARSKGSKAKKF